VLQIEGIPLEAQLEGTILYLRNRDEPGVIGQIGSTLGKLGVNIATFALGRREAQSGADAVSLVRVDGEVSTSILGPIRAIPAITEAKLLHFRLDRIIWCPAGGIHPVLQVLNTKDRDISPPASYENAGRLSRQFNISNTPEKTYESKKRVVKCQASTRMAPFLPRLKCPLGGVGKVGAGGDGSWQVLVLSVRSI